MFNTSKLMKKAGTKASELEEEIAKTLQHFEQSNAELKAHLRLVYITSAEQVEHKQADGSMSKYILIRTPFRSLASLRKVGKNMIDHLEGKFKWPVVMVANRTIISTRGKLSPQRAQLLFNSYHPRFPVQTPFPYPQGCPQRHP
jgi:hypothetical protein